MYVFVFPKCYLVLEYTIPLKPKLYMRGLFQNGSLTNKIGFFCKSDSQPSKKSGFGKLAL